MSAAWPRALAAFAALSLLAACARQKEASYEQVGVYDKRLTLEKDDGGTLTEIDRSKSPDVTYRVTLQNAPVGARLPLTCRWIDPNQLVAHENAYETQEITKEVWDTHCHALFGPAAQPGTWHVAMLLQGRELCRVALEVR